jgi:predicted transposase YdaD
MDHDRLFKELIVACFREFVELFMPRLYAETDLDSIEFQDKELFTDIGGGEKHEADIVVKAKVKGENAFFLIHVENQAKAQPAFAERMFRYFARLYEKYHLPVYPVAVLSWDKPKRKEPDYFRVAFPGLEVMDFHYHAIQLNRLDWRDYLHSENPVAAALMSKMNVALRDRPRVKLESLRMIATGRSNPAEKQVVAVFMDAYLPLDAPQQAEFDERLEAAGMKEKEAVMELTTSWERAGLEKGRAQGMVRGLERGTERGRNVLADAVLKFLQQKVGALSEERAERVRGLSLEALGTLSDALLDFRSSADLDAWLAGH